MAEFVHITSTRAAQRIQRSGIAARSFGGAGGRGVYCMPVLPSFTLTYQWVRELRRWKPGVLVAVQLRLGDDEPVSVGHYGAPPRRVTAAEAVAVVRGLDDPRGYEVFVPRTITAAEVRRVRAVPQGVGWRYVPGAHGRRPCPCPGCVPRGGYKVAKLRRRFPYDEPPRPKSELMARLRAAGTADEIIDVLSELGRGRRGGAEELAYLVDHPDPYVRDTLDSVLQVYRGREARRLRQRLQDNEPAAPDPDISCTLRSPVE
ncbi:HEAT repeat domain-containing protein [Actinoplanes sp. NPDC051346]|uniref:HEAT repeat domain-containing protein n=1 Tax=Actinoplanes sp. NPDC051346 TaxID=3155048 RepID=UPI00342C1B03